MTPKHRSNHLHRLARLYGVQTAYYDSNCDRKHAAEESLLEVLKSLGAPVADHRDILPALRERHQELWQRVLEPVFVVRGDDAAEIDVRLPKGIEKNLLSFNIILESGEKKRWDISAADLPVIQSDRVNGIKYQLKRFTLPEKLPWGYHRITLSLQNSIFKSLFISAPSMAYVPCDIDKGRIWGVFLPLYALYSKRRQGCGDYTDLKSLVDYIAGHGGKTVATLPLFPLFLDEQVEPSPYLPVSRLHWNEFYLDVEKTPEVQQCESAKRILQSSAFREQIAALRKSSFVDYHRKMSLKRKLLEELCGFLFSQSSSRLDELNSFAEMNPDVELYAKFRATGEKLGTSWRSWPKHLQGGGINGESYDEDVQRYYLYTQWLAHQQMQDVSRHIKKKGANLLLDLPLGVHPDGYDIWREQRIFVANASAGAPPDAVFTSGQNWGFPPLHPQYIREQGYRYFIAVLRESLKYAGFLRIDHVMSLHRLFYIPQGQEDSKGVYVRYPSNEMYAILSLESYRQRSALVGEDLGTVPRYVRREMNRQRLFRMYVLQYELSSNEKGLKEPSSKSLASLNTHDMPPFASLWFDENQQMACSGFRSIEDISVQSNNNSFLRDKLINYLKKAGWLKEGDLRPLSVLKACLAFLAASRSPVLLVNLEDLWLESRPQNIPASGDRYPNWQRKSYYSIEDIHDKPKLGEIMSMVNDIIEGKKK